MAKRENPSTSTDVVEKVGLQHRVSLGLVSLTLGIVCLSLAVALFLAPAGLAPKLFLLTPGQVSVSATTSSAITLTWTAPGDDGAVGQATSYEIRYSTSPITDQNFSQATLASGAPVPQPAGSTETFTVNNLSAGTLYFFALKTRDEVGNTSILSNVASKQTAALAQACVPTYTCSDWSACTNGTQTRTCTVTNNCPAGLDQPVGSQTCTSPVPPSDTPGSGSGGAVGGTRVRLLKHVIAVGTGSGTNAVVRILNPDTSKLVKEFRPFAGINKNGVKVAVGDLNGDQVGDVVVATSAPSNPLVRVFTDKGAYVTQFNPYPALKLTGISIALGDVDADGKDELITVPDKSIGQVRIFKYSATTKRFTTYAQFQIFPNNFRGGFSVVAEDLDLAGGAEIILAPRVSSSGVYVYSMSGKTAKRVSAFRAYPVNFRTGLLLAAGDTNGDGRPEILTSPGAGYYSDVKAFTIKGKMESHFLPASTAFFGGVDLVSFDTNNDGRDEVLTITYSKGVAGLRIFRYNGANKRFERIRNTQVFPSTMRLGARVGGA